MKKQTIFLLFPLVMLFITSSSFSQIPRILWWFDTNDSSFGNSAIDDLDHDGKPEIVFGCYRNDSMVYVLNAEDGSLLWKYNTSPNGGGGCNDVAPLIYDVTKDGKKEVILPSSCNPVTYCFDGATGNIIWQTPTDGSDSPPVLVDLNNDGNLEIIHGEFGGDVVCMDAATGQIRWDISVDPNSWVQTAPTIVDVNNDSILDFIVATWGFNNNSKLYAYDGGTHTPLWSINMNDVVYHGTAVADLDNDGKPELVIGDYSGTLWAINAEDGSILWTRQESYSIGAPVTIGDINGDGQCEIIAISWFKVLALNGQGQLLWQYDIPGYGSAFRGVVLADITNDTIPEVIFASTNGSVYALEGTTGSLLWSIDLQAHYGDTLEFDHAPVIADFNGDDTLDLFVVGGYTKYPDIQNNYGRGYAIAIGKGAGPDWKMFQRDYYRTSSMCYPGPILQSSPKPIPPVAFSVYPNPVSSQGTLFYETPFRDQPALITLTGADGKVVLQQKAQGNIDMSLLRLAPGFYTLVASHQNLKYYKKLIITE